MNILIACIHYPVASGRYIKRAFERLGHSVRSVGPCTGNQIWGMTVDERHVWEPDYEPLRLEVGWQEMPDGWQPDLVVTADSAWGISKASDNIPHVIWGVDNHVRRYDYSARGIEFDCYFLAHHDGPTHPIDDRWSMRRPHVWLPCAYDPEYFTPSPIPMAEREYDVAMVGVAYPRRVEIIEAMRVAGLKVFATTGALYEDYAAIYHNARISLCVSAAGDVAQRVFETAAMGCYVLTDHCRDFSRGQEYRILDMYDTTEQAISQAKRFLSWSSEEQDRWARTMTAFAAPHTWNARAQVVLDTMFGGER